MRHLESPEPPPPEPAILRRERLSRRNGADRGQRLDSHADRARRHRGRVHSALGARRGERFQIAPQRPLVLLSSRSRVADPLRRVEPRSARHCRRSRRWNADRRARTPHGVPDARRDAVRDHANGCRGRRAAAQGARDHARASRGGRLARPERKRALPRFPRVIAVITSPDGAALHDIIAVVRRRGAAVRLVSSRRQSRATRPDRSSAARSTG